MKNASTVILLSLLSTLTFGIPDRAIAQYTTPNNGTMVRNGSVRTHDNKDYDFEVWAVRTENSAYTQYLLKVWTRETYRQTAGSQYGYFKTIQEAVDAFYCSYGAETGLCRRS